MQIWASNLPIQISQSFFLSNFTKCTWDSFYSSMDKSQNVDCKSKQNLEICFWDLLNFPWFSAHDTHESCFFYHYRYRITQQLTQSNVTSFRLKSNSPCTNCKSKKIWRFVLKYACSNFLSARRSTLMSPALLIITVIGSLDTRHNPMLRHFVQNQMLHVQTVNRNKI